LFIIQYNHYSYLLNTNNFYILLVSQLMPCRPAHNGYYSRVAGPSEALEGSIHKWSVAER